MKKRYETMLGIIFKMFIVLLASIVNASINTKCVSLTNQKCEIQSTLINLRPNECNQEFHNYPFAIKLDRCVGSCKTLNYSSNKVCVPSKAEDLNLSVFNMVTGINESKTLTKHISCEIKCKFVEKNVIQINGGITINVDVSVKSIIYVKKIMFGILVHVFVKMKNIKQVLWMIQ